MKKQGIYLNIWLIAVLLIIITGGCSTKKSTFTHRYYHTVTARYNAYFNGNEALKEGVAALSKANIDDYSKILKIYTLGTADDAQAQNANFEKAYTKASKVIQKHSIFKKNKEYVRWIPEAYLLIGKSYFYKQEYKLAAETFDYIVKQYDNWPVKYNAMLWMVRCYNELKKFEKSESALAQLQNKIDKGLVPKSVIKEFPIVYADFQIKQEKYEQSVEYLLSAIDLNKKKTTNVRLRFILAQIYQRTGNLAEATKLYNKVIKMNPAYVMAFNAKINKAICFDAVNGNSKDLKKLLGKMAKETKNKDYLDQIYYALAEICMKEKDTTCAVDNYKLSASKSVSNNNQKATSFLKLAQIYFSYPKYELAQTYYDSAMTVLPLDYPDYNKIKELSAILGNLVVNLKIVELQDSLQRLAKMSEKERNQVIDEIITNVIKEEQKKKEEEYLKQQNTYAANMDNTLSSTSTAWYFYNTTAVNFGKTEFIKKWGSRKLEDLWRLSNKEAENPFGDIAVGTDSSSVDSSGNFSVNLKDKKYYLKDIPFTPEQVAVSDDKIVAALYNIGQVYQNDLLDNPKAIETYEELIRRFTSKDDYLLKSYFQLYQVYSILNDNIKKDYYKNLVCNKSPESDYCKLIKDPNYRKISTSEKNLAEKLYAETYIAYLSSRWDSVLIKAKRAKVLYDNDTALIPKFMYLNAVALGKSKDSTGITGILKKIIDNYPKNEITPKAQLLYDFCTGKSKNIISAEAPISTPATISEGYKYNEDAIHFYVVIVKLTDKNVKISDIKNAFSNFNTTNYSSSKLTVSNIFLDNTQQLITITNFENSNKAMLYYNAVKDKTSVFGKLNPGDYTQFVISVDNYPSMFKKKDIDNYFKFFVDNYLK